MTVGELTHALEKWIPPEIAWESDNTGLQVGRASAAVVNILLALDATMEVAEEAVKKRANLIVTHHPLFFHPLRSLTPSSRAGRLAMYLAEHRINMYAAHTNLDSARGGVNFALARQIGLQEIEILSPTEESLVKIAVFVPHKHVEKVAKAMFGAGGGRFTKYEECSFRTEGVGTFLGLEGSDPFLGQKGVLERAPETKLEMLASTWKLPAILDAMRRAHPYEEVAYDVYPLRNRNPEYGLGAIGTLPHPLPARRFLEMIRKKLRASVLRYSGNDRAAVRKVAVCGGAGIEFVHDALRNEVDAFLTADVKYHGFQDTAEDILLIDAGHFETEQHVLPALADRIRSILKEHRSHSKVIITGKNTNPVHYYH